MHSIGELFPTDPTFVDNDVEDSSVKSVDFRRFHEHLSILTLIHPLINGIHRRMIGS